MAVALALAADRPGARDRDLHLAHGWHAVTISAPASRVTGAAVHLVAAVCAVHHPVTPARGVDTPTIVTRPLLLRTDPELLQLTAHLVRPVPTVEVVVTAPPPWDTFASSI